MKEIVTFLLLAALLTVAIKAAIMLLLLAGLIFRTKETVGLIAIMAVFAGFSAHPGIGVAMLVIAVATSLFFKRREAKGAGKLLR